MHQGVALVASQDAGSEFTRAGLTGASYGDGKSGHGGAGAQEPAPDFAGADLLNGPRMSSLAAPVSFQAIRIPTKRMIRPMAPCSGSCNSRNGEASPANVSIPIAEPMLIFGVGAAGCGVTGSGGATTVASGSEDSADSIAGGGACLTRFCFCSFLCLTICEMTRGI